MSSRPLDAEGQGPRWPLGCERLPRWPGERRGESRRGSEAAKQRGSEAGPGAPTWPFVPEKPKDDTAALPCALLASRSSVGAKPKLESSTLWFSLQRLFVGLKTQDHPRHL